MGAFDIFKKNPPSKERVELFRIRTAMQIEMYPLNSQGKLLSKTRSYTSKLKEFEGDNEFTFIPPNGRDESFRKKDRFSIIFKTSKGLFKDTMEIRDIYDDEGETIVEARLVGKTTKSQRRLSYRLDYKIPINFQPIQASVKTDKPIEEMTKDEISMLKSRLRVQKFEKGAKLLPDLKVKLAGTTRYPNPLRFNCDGETIDISNGGIKFSTSEELDGDEVIVIVFRLEEDDNTMLFLGGLLHKEKLSNIKFSYKCQFKEITDDEKDKISKFIFKTQLDDHKGGLLDDE